ncbi:hypothetical protein Bbelb_060970 [Branchiostoma belcheri]|nr:hypothetical protein Bbelb_060970 [Branchiostoma belcheri]
MPRRKKKKLTERLSAWKEEQKTEKQPSQQDDKQAEVESVQEVESGVQEPAEMLMEVEVSGEEPVDDQDVQETGAWDSEGGFIFDPFTRADQWNVASMVNSSKRLASLSETRSHPWASANSSRRLGRHSSQGEVSLMDSSLTAHT